MIIELDDRRRTSLGKIGRKEHTRYVATADEDGVITLKPATVVSSDFEVKLRAAAEAARRGETISLDDLLIEFGMTREQLDTE